MLKKALVLMLMFSLIFTSVLVGCTTNNTSTENPPATEEENTDVSQETPDTDEEKADEPKSNNPATKRGNILTMGDAGDLTGKFNPILSSSVYDQWIADLVFDSLITNDREGNPVPQLAEKWDISEDGLTYTFYIHKGVKFHDGEDLTAEDVKFTYEALAHPDYDGSDRYMVEDMVGFEAYQKGEAEDIEGIKVIDDHTISFTIQSISAPKIYDFTIGILPKHVYGFDKYTDFVSHNQNPVGAGPFKFERYVIGQYAQVTRFEDYWGKKPSVEGVIYKEVPRDSLSAEAQAGLLDIVRLPATPEEVEIAEETGIVEVKTNLDNGYGYAGINLRRPKFQDKRVRHALAHGLNREAFVKSYFKGYADVANTAVSPVSWAYTDEVVNYEYDPEKAKALLKEAGWEDRNGDGWIENEQGEKFTIDWVGYTDSQYEQNLMAIAKENYKAIGIDLIPNIMEWSAVIERVYTERNFDMYNMLWSLDIDPDPTGIFDKASDVPGGYNSVGFQNDRSEELIQSGKVELDQEKRAEIYKEWAKLVNDELPYIFLDISQEVMGINKRVKNYTPESYLDWTYQIREMELEY